MSTLITALPGCSCANNSVKDMGGKSFSVQSESSKIVSLWPAMTSSLITLGMGDKIVGVSSNDEQDINDWAKAICPSIKDVKSFSAITPSVDDIKATGADLVIVHPDTLNKGYQDELIDAGITAINLKYINYEEMQKAFSILAKFVDNTSQQNIEKFNTMLKEKTESLASYSNKDQELGPLNAKGYVTNYVPGDSDDVLKIRPLNSVVWDWVDYSNGHYIADYCEKGYDDVTLEPIDFIQSSIIFIGGPYKKSIYNELTSNDVWAKSSAVENNEIYFAPTGVMPWGDIGTESLLMMDFALLQKGITSVGDDQITEDSVKQEAIDFYKDLSGKTFTKEQIGYMFDSLDPTGTKSSEVVSRFR